MFQGSHLLIELKKSPKMDGTKLKNNNNNAKCNEKRHDRNVFPS